MREVFGMWGNTRMVVLTAVTASLYAAILIPFKVLPIIPGVTDFRPANAVPVVCSFLFGPAAAWGAAVGNVIGDFFGGIGPGDLFGFLGNFLYGLLPYKAWQALTRREPLPRAPLEWIAFLGVVGVASAACALCVGWGLNLLGFVPFSLLGNIVLLNNFVVAAILSPPLLFALYPRVRRAGLHFEDIYPAAARGPTFVGRLGLLVVLAATVSGFVAGNLLSTGGAALPFLAAEAGGTHAAQVGLGLLPIVLLLLIGAVLL